MTVLRFANNHYTGLTADTKPTNVPANSTYRDTQLGIIYQYNGSTWNAISGAAANLDTATGTIATAQIEDLAITTGKLATSLTGINAKIPDGEFTWAKVSKTGATVAVKETIACTFAGTAVRVSSMIMGTNLSINGQGTAGHVWGVPITVKRVRIFPITNPKTGNTVIKLWKDATELASWTISAGSTTEIDSGAITHAITATEEMDLTCDTTAGGAGLSAAIAFVVDIEKTVNLT